MDFKQHKTAMFTMFKMYKTFTVLALVITLTLAMPMAAYAEDETTLFGIVKPGAEHTITAPYSGTIAVVNVTQGLTANMGDTAFVIDTTKVYAPRDGILRMANAAEGDDAAELAAKYGAAMWIEPGTLQITASPGSAYNARENRSLHVGETVYAAHKTSSRSGAGVIVKIDSKSFTVEIHSGNLLAEDDVYIYRGANHATDTRGGGGTAVRAADVAVAASGRIMKLNAKLGDTVKRGDLLMETAAFDGFTAPAPNAAMPEDAIIASVAVKAGDAVSYGQTLAVYYPLADLIIEAEIVEEDLRKVSVGDKVAIKLTYGSAADAGDGAISSISAISHGSSGEALYTITIQPDTVLLNRIGLSVEITLP